MPGNVTSPGAAAKPGAAPVLASNALPIGTRIHEFEITRVVGEGGFSVVYLAFDHTLHRSIALKEYIPSALASRRGDQTVAVRSAQHQQTFEAGLRSFINEARLLAQFDHPALVKVYRFWEANGTAYMAMPYYEGRTLKDILREHPEQASEAWLKGLLAPLLDALALLHDHHCYHRDIAPDNVQILDNGQPVLLDFGAARRTIGDMTQAFTVILKPGYAPIEQYAEETDLKQGPWTDVYALSAVLYGAIVGKPPPTAVARVIKDPLEPLATRGIAGFDAAFLSGIDRGLAVRPEARPQSVVAWRRMLGVDEHAPTQTSHASFTTDAPRAPGVGDAQARAEKHAEPSAGDASGIDAAAESDRTVLVPGLRRTATPSPTVKPSATQPPATAAPAHATAASAPPATPAGGPASIARADASTRSIARPAAIAGALVVIVAIVAWLVVARPFGGPAQPPAVANAHDAAPSTASPAPAPSLPPAQAPGSVPPPTQAAAPAQVPAQRPASAPPTQAPANPQVATREPALAQAPSSGASMPAAIAPAPDAHPQPTESAPATPPRPPAVPEDERRWAALRNSDSIDDLRAFRRRFPQSPHAQDAAVRIQQLARESRENAREAEPARPAAAPATTIAKAAPAAPPKADTSGQGKAAAAGAGATTASSASKATVRVRVQPFGYVYVDGALIGPSPPSREIQLSPGKHRIEARNDQETPPVIHREIDVAGGESTEVPLRFRE